MMQPKKTRFRKAFKGRIRGNAKGGFALNFGEFLFRDLRYRSDGSESPDFVLNKPAYRPARIVLGETNFGCGSSREHAVWALYDYGIRAVIAPSMGDIFMSNAAKNGLLTIVLPAAAVARMIEATLAAPGLEIAVDLEAQTVAMPGCRGPAEPRSETGFRSAARPRSARRARCSAAPP